MNKSKNYLFKINTTINKEEFYKFQDFYSNILMKNTFYLKITLIVLVCVLWIYEFLQGNAFKTLLLTAFILIYPVILKQGIKDSIDKAYKKTMSIRNIDETLYFYKDHFENKSKTLVYNIKYNEVYCTCETKNNIYIMKDKRFGFILVKSMINDKDLKGLISLLKENTKYRRYNR